MTNYNNHNNHDNDIPPPIIITWRKILSWFVFFSFLRVINVTWFIETQFDPDEYWQNLEPSYCLIFWKTNNDNDGGDSGGINSFQDRQPHNPIHHNYNSHKKNGSRRRRRSLLSKNYHKGNADADDNGDDVVHFHNKDDRIYISDCPGWTWEWKRRWYDNYSSDDVVSETTTTSTTTTSTTKIINFLFGRYQTVVEHALQGPVRSFTSIIPTLVLYLLLRYMKWDTYYTISKGPLILNAIVVAAVTDVCVWYMSHWMIVKNNNNNNNDDDDKEDTDENQQDNNNNNNNKTTIDNYYFDISSISFWCTYCTCTSWFHAYALVRTYSNSLETVLLTLSLALVCPELLQPKSKSQSTQQQRWNILRPCIAFFLGGICTSIRFTCLTVYIPTGLFLVFQQRSVHTKFIYLWVVCAFCGLLGFTTTLILDRYMYGFWAIPILGNFHFNVIQGFGSLYGIHPIHWYFTAGIPALTGVLLPILVYDLCTMFSWTIAQRRLWIIVLCCVVAHSISAHKEFRFLLPILPMFCLLAGFRLHKWSIRTKSVSRIKALIGFGILLNLIAVIYLGLFHQRAPIAVNRAIVADAVNKTMEPSTSSSFKSSPSGSVYRIHYLMGCHSTPLLSHLHSRLPSASIQFDPWYLDCSPDCRHAAAAAAAYRKKTTTTTMECESDTFERDPRGFVEELYGLPNDTPMECLVDSESGGDTCEAHIQALASSSAMPDYIVCYSSDLNVLLDILELFGMVETQRFVYGINGLQIGSSIIGGESDIFSNNEFTKIDLVKNWTRISLEEMVLFVKKAKR